MNYSIVIPTYNCEGYIKNNLMNLDDYIPKNTELILVDDGSSDNTPKIITDFKKNRKNTKVFLNNHINPATQRNFGWMKSRCDIVIFLDSDCQITKDWFEEMIKPFSEKNIIAVSGVYKSDQKKLIARFIQRDIENRQNKIRKYTDNLASYSLAIRMRFLKMVRGFPEIYPKASCEDTELSYNLNTLGKFVLNKNAIVYHRHSESVIKYFKKQFDHAKYRILLYKRGNKIGDKYAGFDTIIQPILAFISLFPIFSLTVYIAPLFLFADQLTGIGKLNFTEQLFSVSIGFLRAYVWLAGIIWGVIEFGI